MSPKESAGRNSDARSAQTTVTRHTTETQIDLTLALSGKPAVDTPVPFLSHLLTAMAFHGGWGLTVTAAGDTETDPHHLVEDLGLVLGEALTRIQEQTAPVRRYGHAVIPMDEALSAVTVDVCGRATPVLRASWPQPWCGTFDTALLSEFWKALADRGRLALHGECRWGENSHHMAEALFKALGKALAQAYATVPGSGPDQEKGPLSTKGTLL